MTDAAVALRHALATLGDQGSLDRELIAHAWEAVLSGAATPAQVGALLLGLRVKGETPDEIAGTALAFRAAMVAVPAPQAHGIDTCGTGGGAVSTFNISTVAALIAAAAGARVAKQAHRAFSSGCGGADVLEALGIRILHGAAAASQVLGDCGIACLFGPQYHPALKAVGAARRELAVTTVANLAVPLANPAGVRRQLVGVADAARAAAVAETLLALGTQHALVVHGRVGLDEISPQGLTDVWEVRDGAITPWTIDPTIYRLAIDDVTALHGGGPDDNARRITSLLEDRRTDAAGAAAALLNGGAAIYVAGLAASLAEGIGRARHVLDSGAARAVLDRWRRVSVSTSA